LVVRNSAPLPSVAEIFLFTLPVTLTYTIPMGVLVGILTVLGVWLRIAKSPPCAPAHWAFGHFARMPFSFRYVGLGLGDAQQPVAGTRVPICDGQLQDRLKTSQASFEVRARIL